MMELLCMYCGRVHAVTEKGGVYRIKCDLMDMPRTSEEVVNKWKDVRVMKDYKERGN